MDFEFNQSRPLRQGPNVCGHLVTCSRIRHRSGRLPGRDLGPVLERHCMGDPIDLDEVDGLWRWPVRRRDHQPVAIPGARHRRSELTKQARTFGEAQIDLRLIFQRNSCTSFGSAMLKSRSSDSFTSQLKDFIEPMPIDLQNCGQVIIRKQTSPDEDPNTTIFGYSKSFSTNPATANTFTLTDDGVQDYDDTVLFGSGYTVNENVVSAGWEFVSLDCSDSPAGTATR